VDLHLDLATAPGRSLRARAENALREAVRSGRLPAGTRLPATRALATELGVSRGVVVEAYAQLAAEGYLDTRRGGGTRVAEGGATAAERPCPATALPEPSLPPEGFLYDMRPSLPSTDGFPRQAWLAALTRVLRTVPDERLGYGDRRGEPELRAALAGWLARRRGVIASPDQVLVTGGLRDALPLI
jgi:GntR family transcriptional regulator / MocR family aminotransferase